MARYAARKALVYMSTSGTGNASPITLASWTLNQTTDKIEVTSFGDANKTYVQGLPDISGSFSGFFDNSDTKLFTAADSSDGCKLYLYPSSDAIGDYWYGPAWVDATIECQVSGAVTISGNFAANGSWGRKLV